MLFEQRRSNILSILSRHSFYQLSDLASNLGVSVSTARRDLDALENEGLVRRTHGGVMLVSDKNHLPFFRDRQNNMADEKNIIGRFAAGVVEDGETIIVDGGTTPYQVAINLQNKNVQIVTNSLPVSNYFADSQSVQVISTGGTLFAGTGVFLGPYAEQMLRGIRAQKAFIGVAGVTESGLYNSNSLVVETEKRMIEAAKEVYIVADSSKFDKIALAYLCSLDNVQAIITAQPSKLAKKKIDSLAKNSRTKILFATQ